MYDQGSEVSFDPAKDAETTAKHGILLDRANDFDFNSARFERDDSQEFGEERWNLIGWLDAELHDLTVVFDATRTRAISLRKAEQPEQKRYANRY